MEFQLQPSPILRTSKNVFGGGVQGVWTPAITFDTPGDLSVTYGTQIGHYIRFGPLVYVSALVATSSFTHTTAVDNVRITGLPFKALNKALSMGGTGSWRGITKANYTDMVFQAVGNNTYCNIEASGSGVTPDRVEAADMPSGTAKSFDFSLWYIADDVT